jgi:hypothetical protein
MIADVHRVSGATAENLDAARAIADEAAKAPGTEQLLTLANLDTGEVLAIHLWRDRAAYDANAKRRAELIGEVEQQGAKVDDGELFEVVYRS